MFNERVCFIHSLRYIHTLLFCFDVVCTNIFLNTNQYEIWKEAREYLQYLHPHPTFVRQISCMLMAVNIFQEA